MALDRRPVDDGLPSKGLLYLKLETSDEPMAAGTTGLIRVHPFRLFRGRQARAIRQPGDPTDKGLVGYCSGLGQNFGFIHWIGTK
jgi:hypothetical protein